MRLGSGAWQRGAGFAMAGMIGSVAVSGLASGHAAAQSFPDRQLKMVVPQPPGGGFDLIGRVMAEKLGGALGQAVIVENKTGAGTLVGSDAVAKAAPDGYTLLVGGLPNIVLNVGLYPKLPYDPIKDLTPIGMVVSYPYVLVTRKDFTQKSVKDLLAFARDNPDKLTYASGGRGTGQHIAMAVAAHLAGIKLTHVPYRGAQAAYQDVLGERIDLFFDNISTALPLIEDGRVGVLAVSSKVRHPRLPNIPTLVEAGIGEFVMESWFGIFVPAATPAPVLATLRTAMAKIVERPDVQESFAKTGGIAMKMSTEEATGLVASEMGRWVKLVRDAAVTPE